MLCLIPVSSPLQSQNSPSLYLTILFPLPDALQIRLGQRHHRQDSRNMGDVYIHTQRNVFALNHSTASTVVLASTTSQACQFAHPSVQGESKAGVHDADLSQGLVVQLPLQHAYCTHPAANARRAETLFLLRPALLSRLD